MENDTDLVRISRAGDAFHYRWAARRCLHLVNPATSLKLITIEGSSPAEKALGGEYVIDVAEYHHHGYELFFKAALKKKNVNFEKIHNISDLAWEV